MTWHKDGLRFKCTECGDCCKGEGVVWLTRDDCRVLAKGMEMTVQKFLESQTCIIDGRRALFPVNGDCQFLDSKTNKCKVHDHKPKQCRTYPFWKSVLSSRGSWDLQKQRCEGINTGRLIKEDEILDRMRDRR